MHVGIAYVLAKQVIAGNGLHMVLGQPLLRGQGLAGGDPMLAWGGYKGVMYRAGSHHVALAGQAHAVKTFRCQIGAFA